MAKKDKRTPNTLINIHAQEQANDVQEKTVKMRFRKDVYYNNPNVPYYVAGMIYNVPVSMVDRWLKRGGEIYGNESKLVGSKVEETMPEPKEETPKTEEKTGEDEEV